MYQISLSNLIDRFIINQCKYIYERMQLSVLCSILIKNSTIILYLQVFCLICMIHNSKIGIIIQKQDDY